MKFGCPNDENRTSNPIVQPGISCTSQPSKKGIWTAGNKSKPNVKIDNVVDGHYDYEQKRGFSVRR
ncbi:hypothetical protein [Prevotella amnii]|uniref:hypothetical protein n=1 Tax=Prevotella amnii TaxID=419005 RepID=UPI00138B1761|nr:hypothetical protein [Prevotella amnii]